MLYATTNVTAAQMLDLFDTPVELVAAPGAGLVVVPLYITATSHFNTTPYSEGTFISCYLGEVDINFGQVIGGAVQQGTDRQVLQTWGETFYPEASVQLIEDQPLLLKASGSNPVDGDGTLTVEIGYLIRPIT